MRLIRLVVLILLVLGIALPAMAAEWVELSKSDKYTNYIDEASITKKDNGLVLYTSAYKYFEPEKDIINESVLYTDTVSEHAANCLRGTYAILGWTLFYKGNVVQVFNVEQRNISFDVPSHPDSVRNFNFVCDKAGYGSDAFEKARSDTAQAVNDGKPNSAMPTNRNMRATEALLKNPQVFLNEFIFRGLAGAAFAYGLVWFFMRPKGQKQLDKMGMWHFFGVVTTDIGGALFRLIAMATFAGHSAYDPPAAGGVAGLYMLVVPAFFSAAYIMWLKKKIAYNNGVGHFENTNLNNRSNIAGSNEPVQERKNEAAPAPIKTSAENKITSIEKNDEAIDLARYKQAAGEVETGNRDDALWYKAFADGGGDENATKAAYIRLRVEQLRRAAVAASAVRVTATQPSPAYTPAPPTPARPKPKGANTLYDILGIARKATDEEILAGYQTQKSILDARENQDAETRNRLIFLQHAKEVLLDPIKRAAYDARI